MYSIGENFFYELEGEKVEFSILGDMIIKGKEYLITEDADHNRFVFSYDDEEEEVKPKSSFKKREKEDTFTDDYKEKPVKTTPKVTPIRPSKKQQNLAGMEVCVIKPSSMEDTREIADTLVDNSTVILNLEGIDVELAQRIIDFTSGACYSLGGSLQKVSSYIFVLGPYNVDITGDLQNILGGSAPSVRAGY